MTFKQEIQNAINSFSQIGVQLERVPTSFSFGTYAECRELFYEALLECDKSITTLYRKPEHEKIISWMVNTRNKGLILVGGCGLGKTSILTGVLPVIFQLRQGKILKPVSSKDIKTDDIFLKRWAFCVDDVGTETIQNDYGEVSEPFAVLMSNAEQYLKPVFISTNMTGKEIAARYGKRTLDRIIRLCEVVKMEGESMRR